MYGEHNTFKCHYCDVHVALNGDWRTHATGGCVGGGDGAKQEAATRRASAFGDWRARVRGRVRPEINSSSRNFVGTSPDAQRKARITRVLAERTRP